MTSISHLGLSMHIYEFLIWAPTIAVFFGIFSAFGAYRFLRPSQKQLNAYAALKSLSFRSMAVIIICAIFLGLVTWYGAKLVPLTWRPILWCVPWLCFYTVLLLAWVAATRTYFFRQDNVTYSFKRESSTVISVHVSLSFFRGIVRKIICSRFCALLGQRIVKTSAMKIGKPPSPMQMVSKLRKDINALVQICRTAPREVEYIELMSPWFGSHQHVVLLKRLRRNFRSAAPNAVQKPRFRVMDPCETCYVMRMSPQASNWTLSEKTIGKGRVVLKTAGFTIHRPSSGWLNM